MKNYKTTITGALLALIIAVEPIISKGTIDWKAAGIAALVAIVTYFAKDNNVSGTMTKTLRTHLLTT